MHGTAQRGPLQRHRHNLVERDALRQWAAGRGLLTLHVSLFLSGIVVLFLVNLATAPGDLWVKRVAWLWAILLVIHALTVLLLQLLALLRGDTAPTAVFGPPSYRTGPRASASDRWAPASTASTTTAGADGAAPFTHWPQLAAESPEPTAAALPIAGTWSEWLPASTATDGSASAWSNGDYVPTPDPLPAAPLADRASWEEAGVGAWLSRRGHHGDQTEPDASANGRATSNGPHDHR